MIEIPEIKIKVAVIHCESTYYSRFSCVISGYSTVDKYRKMLDEIAECVIFELAVREDGSTSPVYLVFDSDDSDLIAIVPYSEFYLREILADYIEKSLFPALCRYVSGNGADILTVVKLEFGKHP